MQEVPGSNPGGPTNPANELPNSLITQSGALAFKASVPALISWWLILRDLCLADERLEIPTITALRPELANFIRAQQSIRAQSKRLGLDLGENWETIAVC